MSHSIVPAPSVRLASFACPHCGAHATQHWFNIFATQITGEKPTPSIPTLEIIERIENEIRETKEEKHREFLRGVILNFRRLLTGEPFFEKLDKTPYSAVQVENVFVSRCYTCKKHAIWIHDRMIYPPILGGSPPNPDLSDDVFRDYEEARRIMDQSPRGAAALLRLAVEKICIEVGAKGDTIAQRIAWLVANGMPDEVQQALDAVRVIGNEAIHPGQVDIRDDRDTVTKLFELVNFIAYDRISRQKQIASVYDMIPESTRKAIESRNAKAKNS